MKAIAYEGLELRLFSDIDDWLESNYGESSKKTWYIDQDYDLLDLCMDDKIFTHFLLVWGDRLRGNNGSI